MRSARMQARRSLLTLRDGESACLGSLEVPEEWEFRLMELGFIPGARVELTHRAPGGDPRVYRVDGAEIALRNETAAQLFLEDPEVTR